MHNIKQWHNGKILFSLFIHLLIVCCATTLAKKEKGIAEDTPQPCPICKPGTGLEKYCGIGYHGGTDQSCEPCKEGETYNEREGSYRCLPCQNCDRYSRETIYKCRESLNSKCGPCKPGYYSYQKYNRSIPSVRLESCSPCRGPEDHPDCFQHFTTVTGLSETTLEVKGLSVKEHDHNSDWRIVLIVAVPILFVLLFLFLFVIPMVRKWGRPTDRPDSISKTKEQRQHLLSSDATADNDNNQSKDVPDCCISMSDETSETASQEKRNRGVASWHRSEPPTKIAKKSPSHADKLRPKEELQKSPCAVDSRAKESKIDLSYSEDGNKELEAVGGNSCHGYSGDRSASPGTNGQQAPDATVPQAEGINLNPTFRSSNLEVNEVVTDQFSNLEVCEVVTDQSSNLEVNEVVTDQSINPELNEDVYCRFMSPPPSAKAQKKVDANTRRVNCSSQPSSLPTNIINYNFHGQCQNIFNHGNNNTVSNAQNQGQTTTTKYDNNANTGAIPPNCSMKQEDPGEQEKFPEPESSVGPCECNTSPGHISQPQPSMEGPCTRCHEKACSCNVATEPKVPEDSTLTQTALANVVSPQQPYDIPVEEICAKNGKTEMVSSVS